MGARRKLTTLHAGPLAAKVTTVVGKRAELTTILKESADNMPECLSYAVVAGFDQVAATSPVWAVGLGPAHTGLHLWPK